jgi:hypothetical protein
MTLLSATAVTARRHLARSCGHAHNRSEPIGDAAFVARPHVAKGTIKAGHDAIERAAARQRGCRDGLTRYDAVRPGKCAGRRRVARLGGPTSKAKRSALPIPSPSCARMAALRPQTEPTVGSASDCWRKLASPDSARRHVANFAHGLKTPLATLAVIMDERGC